MPGDLAKVGVAPTVRPVGPPAPCWGLHPCAAHASMGDGVDCPVDPAALPVEDLAGGYCQAVKPEPAEVDAKVQEYPGATVTEFNDFYDYLLTYVAPLCTDLPTATGVKGVKRMSAKVVADL